MESKPEDKLFWTHWISPIHDLSIESTKHVEQVIVAAMPKGFGYDYKVHIVAIHDHESKHVSHVIGSEYFTKKAWLLEGLYLPIEVGSQWQHMTTDLSCVVTCIKNWPMLNIDGHEFSKINMHVSSLKFYKAQEGNRCLQPSAGLF